MRLPQLLAALALFALACAKKQEAPRRTEPWPASAKSGSTSAAPGGVSRFDFNASESTIRFSLPSRKAKLSGNLPLTRGELQLDPHELKSAQANLEADLSRITLDESSLPHNGSAPSGESRARALNWLELGAEVPEERRAQFARSRFELAALENVSSPVLDVRAAPGRAGQVRATAVGTLLLHGYRAPVRAEVLLQTLTKAPNGSVRLSIRSAAPLVLPLAPHDIVARGPSGMADPLQTARAADVVGAHVHIEFELVAEARK